MAVLYVFIDVSGNYDFADTGTKYLVLTSVTCSDICPGIIELYTCKHTLIGGGFDIEYFHAAEDKQNVRNQVFDIISKLNHMRIDSVIVQKSKVPVSHQNVSQIYPAMVDKLFRDSLGNTDFEIKKYDKIFIFMDRESAHAKDREPFIKGVKKYLSQQLSKVPYRILMHSSMSHMYLQIVDYCSWAIYRKWEINDLRPYEKVNGLLRSELLLYEDKESCQ